LKGGLVLELRLDRARTTKDVDIRIMGSQENVLGQLQRAGQLDLGDFMTFEVRPDPRHPGIRNEGIPYGGLRFRAEARLAGKLFGQPFGVDVAFADVIVGEPDEIIADDMLSFAGLAPPTLRLYPLESHIAEKLHAYTMPRDRPNSRVKDLPDLALLASVREIEARRLRRALDETFVFRKTHDLPRAVPAPPPQWTDVYARMAREDTLEWKELPDLFVAVKRFLDPVLDEGDSPGRWLPRQWSWE
jgi:hypothetical protein